MEEIKETQVVIESNTEGILQTPTKLTSAGYSYIYDTITGDRSKTNNNMLPAQLRKKRPDGSLRFTTVKPNFIPSGGTLKCNLHKDNPNREIYNDMGLPVCKKHNLTSPFQVKRHMQKRHPMEWAAIEDMRISREKQEDREFQRSIIGMATSKKEEPPLYVSKKDNIK